MQDIASVPQREARQGTIFVHTELAKCSHVFVRVDKVTKPLTPPYEGPYRVLKRNDKHFLVQLPTRESNISVDRLKPAFLLSEEKSEIQTETTNTKTYVTRAGRVSRPTVRFANDSKT